MKKNTRILITVLSLVFVIVAMLFCWRTFSPKASVGDKTIGITVAYDDVEKEYTIHTSETYLRGALDQNKLIAGDESEFGLFVKAVDGRTVDDSKQEWWCFTKDGNDVMTGVDSTPIADGDHFEITLKVGY